MNWRKLAWLVFGGGVALIAWFVFQRVGLGEQAWIGLGVLSVAAAAGMLAWIGIGILLSMPTGFRWLTIGAVIALGAFWLCSQPNGENVRWWIAGPGMFGIVWIYYIFYVQKRGDLANLGKRDIWIAMGLTVLMIALVTGFLAIVKHFQNEANNNPTVEELIRWE